MSLSALAELFASFLVAFKRRAAAARPPIGWPLVETEAQRRYRRGSPFS